MIVQKPGQERPGLLIIILPDSVLGTDGADGGIGGVIPMLAEGAAVVYSYADGAFHRNLLKIGRMMRAMSCG